MWWLRFVARPVLPILGVTIGLWLLAGLTALAAPYQGAVARTLAGLRCAAGASLIVVALALPWRA